MIMRRQSERSGVLGETTKLLGHLKDKAQAKDGNRPIEKIEQSLGVKKAVPKCEHWYRYHHWRAARAFNVNSSHPFNVELRTAWNHEYATLNDPLSVAFAEASDSAFSVQATPRERDLASIGVRGRIHFSSACDGYLNYLAMLSSSQSSESISGGMVLKW